MTQFLDALKALPYTVPWHEVSEFGSVDERVTAVNDLFANLVSVEDGYFEWLPDHEPPALNEAIAWAWVIHPEWKSELIRLADDDLRAAIVDTEAND